MASFDNQTEGTETVLAGNQTDSYEGFTEAPPELIQALSQNLLKKLELINIGKDIHKYVMPGIILLGLIGNILSLMIFHRPFIRKSSAAVYFSALAVADSVALLDHLAHKWVSYFFRVDPNPYRITYLDFSDILCKFMLALFTFSFEWAAWIVVALTAERVVITYFPLKGKLWCTRRSALIVVVSISVFLAALNIFQVAVHGVSMGKCNDKAYYIWAFDYGYWIALVLYTLAPSPVLFILNGAMIIRLAKARGLRRELTGLSTNHKSNDAISKATVAAVTVSVTYFILTLPSTTLNLINVMTDLGQKYLELQFVHYLGLTFRTANNAVNFGIYLASYPKIRTEFVAMVTMCCPRVFRPKKRRMSLASISTGCTQDGVTDNPMPHPTGGIKRSGAFSKF